jgi:hypothetical protein
MATGDAQAWQVVLAVLLMLAAVGGINRNRSLDAASLCAGHDELF